MAIRRHPLAAHKLRLALFALLLAVSCVTATNDGTHPTFASATRPPIIPSSWTQAAWFIDPASGLDTNTGITTGSPLKTWQELVARWGTISPRLRQTTTITFKSSHTDNTDPVYFSPFLENGASAILTGSLTQVASVSITSITAKNRATPQLLQGDIGASGATGQLLVNTTRANSRAWTYKLVSGTTFAISQPITPLASPPVTLSFGENNSWANTDTVTLNTLTAVNIVSFMPQVADSIGSNAAGYIYQLQVFDTGSSDPLYINQQVRSLDSAFVRPFNVRSHQDTSNGFCCNCNIKTGAYKVDGGLSSFYIPAGIVSGGTVSLVNLDEDIIVSGNINISSTSVQQSSGLGEVFIESTKTINAAGGSINVANQGAGTPSVWGPGSFNILGLSHVKYTSTATNTFQLTGTIKINGLTTACSHSGAATDVMNCGITINVANLDAAQGTSGFGSNAFVMGGGSMATTF